MAKNQQLSCDKVELTTLNQPLIRVKFKVHFTAFLGLLGLLTFVFSMVYLLNKKGVVMGEGVLILSLLVVGGYYSFITVRDLNKSERLIEKLIYRVYRTADDSNVDEEDDDD